MILNDVFINVNLFTPEKSTKKQHVTHGLGEYSRAYVEVASFLKKKV